MITVAYTPDLINIYLLHRGLARAQKYPPVHGHERDHRSFEHFLI